MTGLMKSGENLIAVRVLKDYMELENANEIATIAVTVEVTNEMLKDLPHGFYRDNPAGIWQPVKLVITDPVKVQDVYIKPNLTGAEIDVTVKNQPSLTLACNISSSLFIILVFPSSYSAFNSLLRCFRSIQLFI